MILIKTKTGKEYGCDMIAENPTPARLYLHLVTDDIADVAATFTNPDELPIQGHSAYKVFQSISIAGNGINVALKKKGS